MKKSFSFENRKESLKKFKTEKYDLLIVGGGITGAGVARDAASRGMKVALVEANDFAFGTSSRSTKLIHGGLRYLENFEFKLVFEALSERHILFQIAPHLVHPLRFVLPIYKSSRVGMFKLGCGMWLYDLLSRFQGKIHERLSSQQTKKRIPQVETKNLKGSYVYSDAYMDDDRLVFETLRSASFMGADCVHYVEAEKPILKDGKVVGASCKDKMTGEVLEISAHHVVSNVGPWTDLVGHKLKRDWQDILKPSKGVHVTLPLEKFPVKDAVVLSDDAKSRIIFVVPRNDMVVIGTTDTSYQGKPEDAKALNEDVDYLAEMLNAYFPDAKLSREDFISSYVGIRPLVKSNAEDVGTTSREHYIKSYKEGMTFVAGGKYTTYRKMAEEIVDESLQFFEESQMSHWKGSQTNLALNPLCTPEKVKESRELLPQLAEKNTLPFEWVEALWKRFGGETAEVIEKVQKYRDSGDAALWMGEAHHAIHQTMCTNLIDFYVRRTPLFLGIKNQGMEFVEDIARVFAEELRWSDEERSKQVQALKEFREAELGWKEL